MRQPHMIYFADPMCSWCWGFAPVIAAITRYFGTTAPVRLVLGGLRPGTTAPLDDARRDSLRTHWMHVHEASGQAFDDGFFQRKGFIYDTDPACRAITVIRRTHPERALEALHRMQEAFYAHNRDITHPDELSGIAAAMGLDAAAFHAALDSEETRHETLRQYAISQQTGVTGFPTLIAGMGGGEPYAIVTQGFEQGARLLPALTAWFAERGVGPQI
jgi:putative protein-disulfide isomerase